MFLSSFFLFSLSYLFGAICIWVIYKLFLDSIRIQFYLFMTRSRGLSYRVIFVFVLFLPV